MEACAATEILKKPWPTYGMTQIMLQPVIYASGLRSSSEASSGGTALAAVQPGSLPRRRGPLTRDRGHSRLDR